VVQINQKEIVGILKKHGWIETKRGNGSHVIMVDPDTDAITTIPHNKEIPKGTLAAIRRQTKIDEIR
jgi:predicted RNA binding protein YcfA (HicA-like mRNA interferase family)